MVLLQRYSKETAFDIYNTIYPLPTCQVNCVLDFRDAINFVVSYGIDMTMINCETPLVFLGIFLDENDR